ncbi:hypothetical protein BASA83_010724 [Batrachochytrium salamandrivorans]|nr:hypothetical protein BASA83_010724 [Batrachochytrium salamandrivorans]
MKARISLMGTRVFYGRMQKMLRKLPIELELPWISLLEYILLLPRVAKLQSSNKASTFDRHARDEVRLRAEMQSKVAAKEKREKEDMLRMLAQKAREERAGLVSGSGEAPSADNFISSALASSIPARVPHDQDEADNMSEGEEELSEEQSRMMTERDNLAT